MTEAEKANNAEALVGKNAMSGFPSTDECGRRILKRCPGR